VDQGNGPVSVAAQATTAIVVGDDEAGGGADALAFATAFAEATGRELVVEQVARGATAGAEIAQMARRVAAGLVVLGGHGRAGRAHGAVAEQVLHDAGCPVVIVPEGWSSDPHPIRVVGVAFDGRPESRRALRVAADIADDASASMRVVAVAHPVRPAHPDASTAAPVEREPLGEALHDAVAELPGRLRALPVLDHGDPVAELAQESAVGLDLLVCGSRGLGPVRGVLFGSVTRALARVAGCPLLIIPRDAEQD
jgi:nucleotide-binding universal stress UspA family protein